MFEEIAVEVIRFDAEDVITESNGILLPDDD